MEICHSQPLKREKPLSIIEAKNRIRLGHDESCNCCCCCMPQNSCLKYVQPEVPKSFAPIRYYFKSGVPMEGSTTYKNSYWDGPTGPTVDPILPRDWLTVGDGKITDETTHKLSYLGNWCVKPEPAITPCDKQWLGRGPMQDETTQKHDYPWKFISPPESIKARDNLYFPCASLSDDTTYRLSYFQNNCYLPSESFAPKRAYSKPQTPMEGHTTYKLSYFTNEVPPKEPLPWKPKTDYHRPVDPMENFTTYSLSYWPHSEKPRSPFTIKEADNILNAGCCFEDNTTYQLSYFNCGAEKRDPLPPPGNISFSSCPLSHDTVHRLSFLGNWCVEPDKAITPCDKPLLGRGPMQKETTQKHDFTWKSCKPPDEIRPEEHLTCAPLPLECCTTQRLSYMGQNHESLLPAVSYKPCRAYKQPDVPMESETTMRLSYQPVEPLEPTYKPWSKPPPYHAPVNKVEDETTYKLSYLPPGTLVPLNCNVPPTCTAAMPCQPCPAC